MRRIDKALTERSDIDSVIRRSETCRLAMADQGEPYLVTMHFGYDGSGLYFHSAPEGKKIDILKKNPRVWFEFHISGDLYRPKRGSCGWTTEYESVMGAGKVVFINDEEEKRRAMDILMNQYAPGEDYDYDPAVLNRTLLFRVDIRSLSGKKSSAPRMDAADD